jgi:hypothetical protein
VTSGEDLLDRLVEVGARVVATDGRRLIVRAGRLPVPGELVRQLREAKDDVLATLAPGWWRRQFAVRAIDRELSGVRPHEDAVQLAWSELECRWHRLYGERIPEWQCAGCRDPIGGRAALALADGCRVHLDDTDGLDCLLRYGERWRGAATRSLIDMGLRSPVGEGAP